MKLEIYGKNYDPSESLIQQTTKKCAKFERRLKKDKDAVVKFVVTLEGENYTSDASVMTKGITYRAEATSDNPFSNLDEVIPKLLGQMRKQKDIWGRNKKGTPNVYDEEE